jgi:hypothetical protein
MSKLSSVFPFQVKATILPSEEKEGQTSVPGKLVSGTEARAVGGASVRGRLNQSHAAAATTATTLTTPITAHVPRRACAGAVAAPSTPESDYSFSSSNSTLRSFISWNRRSGSFRRQRLISFSRSCGIAGTRALAGFGSSFRIADRVDSLLGP